MKKEPIFKLRYRLIERRWNFAKRFPILMPMEVLNYSSGISEATEIPLRKVLRSEPVKNYKDAILKKKASRKL